MRVTRGTVFQKMCLRCPKALNTSSRSLFPHSVTIERMCTVQETFLCMQRLNVLFCINIEDTTVDGCHVLLVKTQTKHRCEYKEPSH